VRVEPQGTLEQILVGPAHDATGHLNLTGALRRAMALTGYDTLKDLQMADLVVSDP
jgi:IMP dehydrogenase